MMGPMPLTSFILIIIYTLLLGMLVSMFMALIPRGLLALLVARLSMPNTSRLRVITQVTSPYGKAKRSIPLSLQLLLLMVVAGLLLIQ